jgi:hypothetical protein
VFLSFSRNIREENGDELDEALDPLDVTGDAVGECGVCVCERERERERKREREEERAR